MISFTKKFAMIHVNKAGGTSYIDALREFEDPTDDSLVHAPAYLVRDVMGQALWDEFKTFGFIRNPFDRLVSSYEYRRQILPPTTNTIPAKSMPFPEWVIEFVGSMPKDREWGSQMKMLRERDSKELLVDRVFLFDLLVESLPEVCKWLGVPPRELPHFNKTDHPDWETYYDEKSAEFVLDRFADDIEYQRENFEVPWKVWERPVSKKKAK